jgi:hypothetical protein
MLKLARNLCCDALLIKPHVLGEALSPVLAALYAATKEEKADRTTMINFVRKDGRAISFATIELREDPAIISAALRQNGCALQHCHSRTQGDASMVHIAIRQACLFVSTLAREPPHRLEGPSRSCLRPPRAP